MSFEHRLNISKQLGRNTLLILFGITVEFTTLDNCILKVLSFLLYLKILNAYVKTTLNDHWSQWTKKLQAVWDGFVYVLW